MPESEDKFLSDRCTMEYRCEGEGEWQKVDASVAIRGNEINITYFDDERFEYEVVKREGNRFDVKMTRPSHRNGNGHLTWDKDEKYFLHGYCSETGENWEWRFFEKPE